MSYYLLDHKNPTGPNYYTARRRPLLAIVVHCTAGLEDLDLIGPDSSAEGTARYAATTDRDVSWHSGSDTDTFLDLLPYSYTAWQCVDYNSSTAGHEISKLDMTWADEAPEWVERTLRMAAVGPDGHGGLARKARDNGIPLRRATKAELDRAIAAGGPPVGFVTHYELDPTRRTDPGRDFPWSRFFALMTNPTQEDDMTPDQCEAAVRKVLNLPESGLAVPVGQHDNGKLALILTGNLSNTYNAVNQVKGAIQAVQADVDLTGDDEAHVLAALGGLEQRLTAKLDAEHPVAG